MVYFAVTALTEIFFIVLAKQWPYLMEKWATVDLSMALYTYSKVLNHKLKVTTIFVMVAAFGKYVHI